MKFWIHLLPKGVFWDIESIHTLLYPYENIISHMWLWHIQIVLCYQSAFDTTPFLYLVNQLTVVESSTNLTNFLAVCLHKSKVATTQQLMQLNIFCMCIS